MISAQATILKMEKTASKASRTFKSSPSFLKKVQDLTEAIRHNPGSMWTSVQPLFIELKAYKVKPANPSPQPASADDNNPSTSDQNDSAANTESDSGQGPSKRRKPSARQIQRLEELLAAHHAEIEKYELKELSLDDMDDDENDYLMCERLKARASKIFRRLCELKDRSTEMGGPREKRFKYNGSRYKEVNQHVEKFVNKQTLEERMPDYNDIRKLVKKCDEKYSLKLSRKLQDQESKQVSHNFTDGFPVL